MIFAIFHDFPGLENGLPKFHDFPWPGACNEDINLNELFAQKQDPEPKVKKKQDFSFKPK